MTAAGEFAVGASFEFVVAELIKQGFPVKFVFPVEGAGYEVEANALMKGAKNPEAAKRFLDWAITDNAMKEYSQFKHGVTLPGIPSRPDLPKLVRNQTLPDGLCLAGQEQRGHQEEVGEPLPEVSQHIVIPAKGDFRRWAGVPFFVTDERTVDNFFQMK